MKPEKIGIFGGTFNPPHKGHIHAATAFVEEIGLDKLYIIPDRIPPHKMIDKGDNPEIRLEMTHAAFDKLSDKIQVSDYEINKDGVSYTFETLRHFSEENRILYFLCGTDMFLTLDSWKEPKEIFRLAHIVCVKRDTDSDDRLMTKGDIYREDFGANVHFLNVVPLDISSTELREKVRNNTDVREFLTDEVIKIAEREKLYR